MYKEHLGPQPRLYLANSIYNNPWDVILQKFLWIFVPPPKDVAETPPPAPRRNWSALQPVAEVLFT